VQMSSARKGGWERTAVERTEKAARVAARVADDGRDSGGALIADEGRSHEQDALCAPAVLPRDTG